MISIWDLTDHIDDIHTEATNSLSIQKIHHVIDLDDEAPRFSQLSRFLLKLYRYY